MAHLASLYSETEIGDTAFVDDAVWVRTTDGILAFDLATGETEPVDDLMPDPLVDDPTPTSPDDRWTVLDEPGLTDTLAAEDGETVVPDTGTDRWTFERWLDDTRIVGTAVDGPGGEMVAPADRTTLMICEVPTGACDVLGRPPARRCSTRSGRRPWVGSTCRTATPVDRAVSSDA